MYYPRPGSPKFGILLDPEKIDTGFVGTGGLRNFANGDGALGDSFQAFATVVAHEFAHRFSKLNLSDPSPANPTGTVLLLENLIRTDMGLGPRLSYTDRDGAYHPPYLDTMRTPTLGPNDPQNPLKGSGEYLRLYTFLNTPAPELKMRYPGTGQAATLTEEQKARKAAHEAVMAARAGKLTLAKLTYERLEKDHGDSAAFEALKKNDFLNLLNRHIGNEVFHKNNNLPIDKSEYSNIFTFDMIDLNGNGP
jgi:hypothetical protein